MCLKGRVQLFTDIDLLTKTVLLQKVFSGKIQREDFAMRNSKLTGD
jgi:hypothetical protein